MSNGTSPRLHGMIGLVPIMTGDEPPTVVPPPNTIASPVGELPVGPFLQYVAARQEAYAYRCVLSLLSYHAKVKGVPITGQVERHVRVWQTNAEAREAAARSEYMRQFGVSRCQPPEADT